MRTILIFLILLPFITYSQDTRYVDSLNNVIKSSKNSEQVINAYEKLISNYSNAGNSSQAILELKNLSIFCDSNNSNCEEIINYYKAKTYFNQYKLDDAISYYDKALKASGKSNNDYFYIYSSSGKAEALLHKNKFDEAEKLLKNTELKYSGKKNIELKGVFLLLGYINYDKEDMIHALEYYLKTDDLIVKNDLENRPYKIIAQNQIAIIYKEMKNYPKAIEYVNKNLSLIEKQNFRNYYETIRLKGEIEIELQKHDAAYKSLKQSYDGFVKLDDNPNKFTTSISLGEVLFNLKKIDSSIFYLKSAEAFFIQNNFFNSLVKINNVLAKNYLAKNDVLNATTYVAKSNKLLVYGVKKEDALELVNIKIKLADLTSNYSEISSLLGLKDSITNLINQKNTKNAFHELEAKYQTQKKEQQIKLLSTQNELAEKQKYIYIGLLGLLVILGASLFYNYRNKIKTAQKLNELNELKSRFFANISHEFRTPLTLIKSPVQSLQAEISDENQKNKLHLIDKNSNRMLELVDQLLELSKLDSGKLKLILKEGNIGLFLNSIVESFSFQAKENKLSFSSTIEKNTENHHFDKDVIEKIVTNLLSNAIKYTSENEKVSFQSKIENNQLQLVVSNSGSEVKKEELPKLFERFYQKKENHKGVGIGLALVKELVELYNGKIETTVENGLLSFTVLLPLEKSNSNAIVVSKETTYSLNDQNTNESELPILLLVDDNQDVRTVLKDIFKENYQIIEAADGEQALKIAKKEIPDCIISDVMMPKMDGFEFTKQIKTNELTSFIPIILLTAKTSDEAHLEGLKSTADAFLTKPFNNEIVKATVLQLIAERKKLHTRYSQELVLRPVDIVINSVEEKFIEKLQLILNKELANSEFSSDDFAASIGMSRMQLHRKLKSLLGVSTSEFLRNERLKASTELLKKGKANISEIAYSVGFNDVSYFSKCFKEMYHCTPTEYMERN
jgi:signal transduction histidine kinase/DNA-binding response OmpR family regulator